MSFVSQILIAFLSGIFIHQALPQMPIVWGLFAIMLFFLSLFVYRKKEVLPHQLMLLVAVLIGILRGQFASPALMLPEGNINTTAVISSEPDLREKTAWYTVKIPVQEADLLIETRRYPRYHFGEQIQLEGRVEAPKNFGHFSYEAFLAGKGISGIVRFPKIEPIMTFASSGTQKLQMTFLHIKDQFKNQLQNVFPFEPHAGTIQGLLMGEDHAIPEQTRKNFQAAGLAHIMAVSGYNITLLITFLFLLFKGCREKIRLLLTLLGIGFFTLFVGASASVLRAAIMGSIGLLALKHHRMEQTLHLLLLAAVLMTMWNPLLLISDIGFQLSCLATFGLIVLSPLLGSLLSFLPKSFLIRDSIVMTTAAQIMTLPLILFSFGKFSSYAVMSNLLISGPIIPLSMLFSFLSTIMSFLDVSTAKLMAFPAYLFITYLSFIANTIAELPGSVIPISWFSSLFLFSSLGFLLLFLIRFWKQKKILDQQIQDQQLCFEASIAKILYAVPNLRSSL